MLESKIMLEWSAEQVVKLVLGGSRQLLHPFWPQGLAPILCFAFPTRCFRWSGKNQIFLTLSDLLSLRETDIQVPCDVRVVWARLDCGDVSAGTRAPPAVLGRPLTLLRARCWLCSLVLGHGVVPKRTNSADLTRRGGRQSVCRVVCRRLKLGTHGDVVRNVSIVPAEVWTRATAESQGQGCFSRASADTSGGSSGELVWGLARKASFLQGERRRELVHRRGPLHSTDSGVLTTAARWSLCAQPVAGSGPQAQAVFHRRPRRTTRRLEVRLLSQSWARRRRRKRTRPQSSCKRGTTGPAHCATRHMSTTRCGVRPGDWRQQRSESGFQRLRGNSGPRVVTKR